MKNKTAFTAIILTMMIVITFLPMVSNVKASGDLSVYPSTYTATALGDVFTIDVKIANALYVWGFDFKLGYDTNVLDALEIVEGSFLKSFGDTLVVKLDIYEPEGFIWVAIILKDPAATADGSGTLATIKFQSVGVGECVFNLYDITLAGPDVNGDEIVNILDVKLVVDHYGETGEPGWIPEDIDLDGEVELDDLHIVLINQVVITATITIKPGTLNLKSNGEWITCYIELPEGYNVSDIWLTIVWKDIGPPVLSVDGYSDEMDPDALTQIGDYDSDGIPDLMVTFRRAPLRDYLIQMDYDSSEGLNYFWVEATVKGVVAWTLFEGVSAPIKVLNK